MIKKMGGNVKSLFLDCLRGDVKPLLLEGGRVEQRLPKMGGNVKLLFLDGAWV